MTDDEIAQLLEAVAAGHTGAKAAQSRLMMAAGYDAATAEEAVFTALGGSDLVETDRESGEEVYHASRRRVRDVMAAMGR